MNQPGNSPFRNNAVLFYCCRVPFAKVSFWSVWLTSDFFFSLKQSKAFRVLKTHREKICVCVKAHGWKSIAFGLSGVLRHEPHDS